MNTSESDIKKNGKSATFSKFHEKVQLKYESMQKRLLKSQSIDCLDDLCVEKCNRNNDDSSSREVFDKDDVKIEVIDYDLQEESIEELKSIFFEDTLSSDRENNYKDIQDKTREEYHKVRYLSPKRNSFSFFGDDVKAKSTESLSDTRGDFGETPSSPSPFPGFRKRLKDRFNAMRERRKQETIVAKERRDSWYVFSNTTKQEPNIIKPVKKVKEATVTLALIEMECGVNYLKDDKAINYENATTLPIYCRFRLGTEKTRSKNIRRISSKYQWLELFNFNYYGSDSLEISLCNKDSVVDKFFLELDSIEREKTHQKIIEFNKIYPDIKVLTLLTITGTNTDTVIDGESYEESVSEMDEMKNKFAWYRFEDTPDVGFLSVIVYGAKGLFSQNTYCIVELDNERRQTVTEYKTNEPTWMKKFCFNITDITSILEITVRDEKKSEDIGKISVPLLKINDGEKKWFALKDNTQRERAKGINPRILLEMRISWNLIKASLKVINPKEAKLLEKESKIDTKVFSSNITRARAILSWIFGAFHIVKTCFEWESRKTNVIALTSWLIFCRCFEVWMLPLLLLIPFIWYRPRKYFLIDWNNNTDEEVTSEFDHNEEIADADSKSDKEAKTTILQKIHILQAMVSAVQKGIGTFGSFGECIKNLYNFTTPFISLLAILLLSSVSLVMYLIPTEYIFMAWGVHKFTRKILRPNRVPNNEILDLLSRVPDDVVMQNCEELPLIDTDEEDNKKT